MQAELFIYLPTLSFCGQDFCKSNRPILLKLDLMIGPTNRKNRLIFGGGPDTDPNRFSTVAE